MIHMIVAADEQNVIGKDNQLIWHLPDDLRFFKRKTDGHAIIMGRHTFESVGRPLPNRTNIIVTRDPNYQADGCIVANSLQEALNEAHKVDNNPFVVGGEQIYRLALPLADVVYLTRIHHRFEGDRHFPELGPEWTETESIPHPADEQHAYPFTFKTFTRS